MEDVFLKSAQNKYRFKTAKGSLNSEQLFDLSRTELNDLYISLEAKKSKSNGLLGAMVDFEVSTKMAVVTAVFNILEEKAKAAEKRAANKVFKQKVLVALENKEMGEIESKSYEELKALAEGLD